MVRGIRLVSRGLLAATVLALVAVVCARVNILPVGLPLEAVIPVLLLIGGGAGAAATYARPIAPMDAARLAEQRLGLKERLSSALEFARAALAAPPDPEAALLRRLQGEDAATHARAVRAADAVPLRLPWEAKALIPAFVLLLLALILPSLSVFTPPALRTERAVVQKEGEKLTRTARTIEKQADAQNLPQTKRAAQDIQKLGQRMGQGRMDKKQALREMHELSRQMADEQRRQAQANSQPGGGDKTLAQAGDQLGQSLQNQNGSGASENAKTNGKRVPPGRAGAKGGAQGSQSQSSAGRKTTPEVKQAAEGMRQLDAHKLAESLRRLAQRAESGRMSPSEQQQAGADLQKLAQSLQNTPYTETQQHVQAAADALKRGDNQAAAREMRQAADAAEREAQRRNDAQGMQNAQQSVQNGQQEMAQAAKPGDIPQNGQQGQQGRQGQGSQPGQSGQQGKGGQSGEGSKAGQGKGQPGGQSPGKGTNGQSGGSPGNDGSGDGPSTASTPGKGQTTPASGRGQKTPGHSTGVVRGAAHPLNPKFDPAKNPKYGKIFLGKPGPGPNGGKLLPPGKPAPPNGGGRQTSVVPYESYAAPARKSAESAMDKEDIPPSYKSGVRRYFDSLQPTSSPGGAHK